MAEDGSCVNPNFWDAAPVSSVCEEDMPCWDCKTMGNRLCGANPVERVVAWGKFNTSTLPAETLGTGFRVDYLGTAMPGIDFPPADHLTIPSSITVNTVHVFRISA
jgi:hypothetical protein